MKTKNKNVNIKGLELSMLNVLHYIEAACQYVNGDNYIMTVTSARDGKHMKGSKHYTGEAIDIRTRDMVDEIGTAQVIKRYLGKDYDVIFEKDHIHIEYDPK